MEAAAETHRAIDAVWRIESARVIAALARIVRDVGRAEDLAQEALVAALEQWPREGIPDNPGAWLTTTAKHRAIDEIRHNAMAERKREEIAAEMDVIETPDLDAQADDDIGDDLLTLIFTACHPVLATEARIALTLRLVGALTTPEIARAFVVPEKTMAQRIVRAKKTLRDAGVSFETPHGDERDERLASACEVVYAIFNEGYAATTGDDWMRPALTEDALRLGRILAGLAPGEPEVHGLMALMEIQASRAKARTDADGAPILLSDQDRSKWDQLLIRRGLGALERSESMTGDRIPGPYTLQAAIAACHARARTLDDTDWDRIALLYAHLSTRTGSPVVELNRAVAVGMASGPEAGLAVADQVAAGGELEGYHLLPSVRGDLLAKLGRDQEARAEFERAAGLTANQRERALLLERAAETAR